GRRMAPERKCKKKQHLETFRKVLVDIRREPMEAALPEIPEYEAQVISRAIRAHLRSKRVRQIKRRVYGVRYAEEDLQPAAERGIIRLIETAGRRKSRKRNRKRAQCQQHARPRDIQNATNQNEQAEQRSPAHARKQLMFHARKRRPNAIDHNTPQPPACQKRKRRR